MNSERPVRLAIAANSQISPLRSIPHAYDRLVRLPAGSSVLLRSPKSGKPSVFEANVAILAQQRRFAVVWFSPQGEGRDQTFRRDFELVESADRVEAFFHVDSPMLGGTGHVVEAAWARNVPCYAWLIDDRGDIERLGEWEMAEPDLV